MSARKILKTCTSICWLIDDIDILLTFRNYWARMRHLPCTANERQTASEVGAATWFLSQTQEEALWGSLQFITDWSRETSTRNTSGPLTWKGAFYGKREWRALVRIHQLVGCHQFISRSNNFGRPLPSWIDQPAVLISTIFFPDIRISWKLENKL